MTRIGIALGGFMGVGKSTVGRRLARALSLPFVDLDTELEQAFGPIPEQFAAVGEAGFRARERGLLVSLCDGNARVLATGGGAWVDPENRAALARCYRTVVLQAPLEVLEARVAGSGRPLWDDEVRRRYVERQPAYADAQLVVETDGRTPEAIVGIIVSELGLEVP